MLEVEIQKTEHDLDEELEHYNGGIFMSSAWLNAIATPERKPVYFRFLHNGNAIALLGGLELMVNGSNEKQLFSFSGITHLTSDPALGIKCGLALYDFARNENYSRISLKSYDNQTYIPSGTGMFRRMDMLEYVFDMKRDREYLYMGLNTRFRRARKAGLVFCRSRSPEMTGQLLSLLKETSEVRKSKGHSEYNFLHFPFLNPGAIDRLLISGYGEYFWAEQNNRILSMTFNLDWKNRSYGLLMGTSREGYRIDASPFIYSRMLDLFRENGYMYYNIGGIRENTSYTGLKRFKESLGTTVINSSQETTNMICPPLNLLNPFLDLKHLLTHSQMGPWRIRKPVIRALDVLIKNRDWP